MPKPTVQIKDAFVFLDHLYGTPVDYPDEHQYRIGALKNGNEIRTTKIVKIEDNIVETQRTIYNVLNWITDTNE